MVSRWRAVSVVFAAMASVAGCVPDSPPDDCSSFIRADAYLPSQPDMFSPGFWNGIGQPDATLPQTDAIVRAELATIMSVRYANDPVSKAEALAVYDDSVIVAKVAPPNLRGAVALLHGTIGEPAIAALRSSQFREVVYDATLPGSTVAKVVTFLGASDLGVRFNTRFQHERAAALAPTMLHELAMHHDVQNSEQEEISARLFHTIVYAQILLDDPLLAQAPTRLPVLVNAELLARLNSRRDGHLSVLTGDHQLFPESITPSNLEFTAFIEIMTIDGPATPASPLAIQMTDDLLPESVDATISDYDDVIEALDAHPIRSSQLSACDIKRIVTVALRAAPVA